MLLAQLSTDVKALKTKLDNNYYNKEAIDLKFEAERRHYVPLKAVR